MPGTPGAVVAARMLFVTTDERVLLASPRGESWFFLPGGQVRPSETVEVALHRELRDRTGLDARALDFVGCLEHVYDDRGTPRYELNVIFAATLPPGVEIASRDLGIDVNSVAVRDLATFEFRPPALRGVLLSWLSSRRPGWRGLAG
jgi:8-oxo-dGTP diphosphatase